MILLLHAYSRGNSGDGLLVDIAMRLIRDALGDDAPIKVVAMDPQSFGDLDDVVAAPLHGSGTGLLGNAFAAAGGVVRSLLGASGKSSPLGRLIAQADVVVGVGGGYMRAGTPMEAVKSVVAHGSQAYLVSSSATPSVYLSQSVGPFRGILGGVLRRSMNGVDVLCLRDDRSVQEFGDGAQVRRVPDLAVMDLFQRADVSGFRNNFERGYLIARDLEKPKRVRDGYLERLARLRELSPQLEPVIQSTGRGNDDLAFYRYMGWGSEFRAVKEAVAQSGPGVVASVRLHGALQSLISGCPAVHLSYERKGFGAYSDLDISEYVHQATTFDATLASQQVAALSADSSAFWRSVQASKQRIEAQRATVVDAIGAAAARRTGAL